MITPQELSDRDAITRTLRRYSQGLDQREWGLFLSAFHPSALIEVPGYLSKPLFPVEFVEMLSGDFDSARISGQHFLANTLFDIRNDRAHTVTEFFASNAERTGEQGRIQVQRAGGLQVDDLVRQGETWLIVHRTLVQKSDTRRVVDYNESTLALASASTHNGVVAEFQENA